MRRPRPYLPTVWATAFVLLGTFVLQGAEQVNGGGLQMESADDLMASWLKMFGALITVLSIFFLGVIIFKKYGTLLQNKASQGQLKVLECRALNQRNAVYVLDYCGERFLVATGQQGSPEVTPLKTSLGEGISKSGESGELGKENFSREIKKAMHASA
jgi:flagellar biogenesis protein FliO